MLEGEITAFQVFRRDIEFGRAERAEEIWVGDAEYVEPSTECAADANVDLRVCRFRTVGSDCHLESRQAGDLRYEQGAGGTCSPDLDQTVRQVLERISLHDDLMPFICWFWVTRKIRGKIQGTHEHDAARRRVETRSIITGAASGGSG
jgi:hypothetical protein